MTTEKTSVSLEAAIELLQRFQSTGGSRPLRLTIRKHNPGGMSGHGTTEVESISAGFDWTAGQVIIYPAKPLTELSPEQVEAIEKSVRTGSSWHAYEAQKKLRDRILELERQVAAVAARAAEADSALKAVFLDLLQQVDTFIEEQGEANFYTAPARAVRVRLEGKVPLEHLQRGLEEFLSVRGIA